MIGLAAFLVFVGWCVVFVSEQAAIVCFVVAGITAWVSALTRPIEVK